jgi:prepilin-type N-terminal cleavage/methylation domain-containing protein
MNKKLAFSLIELSIVILIIGILVAGVTQSSRLVAQMRLASAQSVTRSADISSIRDMVFWAETSLENSITNSAGSLQIEDGNSVSSWNDINPQISAKINVTQATTANQPTYKALGINGLPSLSFNGSNNILLNTSTTPLPASDKNYSLVLVWRPNSVNIAAGQILMSQSNNVSTGSNLASIYIPPTSSYGFAGDNNDYLPTAVSANTSYVSIITVNNTLASNNISVYTNSNTPSTGTSNAGSANLNLGAQRFSVGARIDNVQYFGGLISEAIIFDRTLKIDEVRSINSYLSKKYGIKIS